MPVYEKLPLAPIALFDSVDLTASAVRNSANPLSMNVLTGDLPPVKRWKAVVGACLVFAIGMAAGSVIRHAILLRRFHEIVRGGPDAISQLFVKRLDDKLRLNSTQLAQLEVIVDRAQNDIITISNESRPRIVHTLDNSAESIRAILMPDQVKKFDNWLARTKTSHL